MLTDPALLDAIQRHAIAAYPQEACGLVTAQGYEPCSNIHPNPTEFFRMPPEADERIAAGEVLAVVHSHPEGPAWPSIADQRQQLAQGVPWGLVVSHPGRAEIPFFWGEGIPEVPLMPRTFRWGPSGTDGAGDCFALVRDWYRLHRGIEIPETPRGPDWLEEGPNLYLAGVRAAGFTSINIEELQEGDGVLFAVQSGGRPNHAGVFLGDGTVLHHMQNRLATRESFAYWRRGAVLCVRPPAPEI